MDKGVKIDIGTKDEFTSGIEIGFGVKLGNDVKTMLETCPELYRTSPYTASLRLVLTDESKVAGCIEVLNGLKGLLGAVPQLQEMLDNGLTINCRGDACNVFIDLHMNEQIAQMIPFTAVLNMMKISDVDFSSAFDFKVCSALDPSVFLTATPEELCEMAVSAKIQGNGAYGHLSNLMKALSEKLAPMLQGNPSAMMAMQLIMSFDKMGFEFKYVPCEVLKVLRECGLGEMLNNQLVGMQMMGNGTLPMAQQMAPMFIGPYVEFLQCLNFGDLEVNAFSPLANANARFNLTIPNLSKWIVDTFLTQ